MKTRYSIILILAIIVTIIIVGNFWDHALLNTVLISLFTIVVGYNIYTNKANQTVIQKRQLNNKILMKDVNNYYAIFLEISNLNTYSQFYELEMGDILFKQVYKNLRKHFSRHELYVYSEDRIVIVQQFTHSNILNYDIRYDEEYRAASKLLHFLQRSKFTYKDNEPYDLTFHIGVASTGMHKYEETLNDVVRLAHFSMIKAKEQGKDIVVANEMLRAIKQDLDSFNKEMESGLKLDEFSPYFHPIIDMTTMKIAGVEALVRWQKNKYRIIEAAKFIDIAQEKELFTEIDKRVIEKTLASYQAWKDNGLIDDGFFLTINLTYKTLLTLTPNYLLSLLEKYKVSVKNIEFDLTERSIIDEASHDAIDKLRSYGFRFSLDTFKDKCFSFQQMLDLDIDTIKIDKSKLPHSEISKKELTFYSQIVDLSRALECKVLSKGIENKYQLTIAQQLNVDYAQGYYFTKPLDDDQIIVYLNKYREGILTH